MSNYFESLKSNTEKIFLNLNILFSPIDFLFGKLVCKLSPFLWAISFVNRFIYIVVYFLLFLGIFSLIDNVNNLSKFYIVVYFLMSSFFIFFILCRIFINKKRNEILTLKNAELKIIVTNFILSFCILSGLYIVNLYIKDRVNSNHTQQEFITIMDFNSIANNIYNEKYPNKNNISINKKLDEINKDKELKSIIIEEYSFLNLNNIYSINDYCFTISFMKKNIFKKLDFKIILKSILLILFLSIIINFFNTNLFFHLFVTGLVSIIMYLYIHKYIGFFIVSLVFFSFISFYLFKYMREIAFLLLFLFSLYILFFNNIFFFDISFLIYYVILVLVSSVYYFTIVRVKLFSPKHS